MKPPYTDLKSAVITDQAAGHGEMAEINWFS